MAFERSIMDKMKIVNEFYVMPDGTLSVDDRDAPTGCKVVGGARVFLRTREPTESGVRYIVFETELQMYCAIGTHTTGEHVLNMLELMAERSLEEGDVPSLQQFRPTEEDWVVYTKSSPPH
jgi:hypothetical protein